MDILLIMWHEVNLSFKQCSKLRVHPAPGVHILEAGCIYFETCAPGVCIDFKEF